MKPPLNLDLSKFFAIIFTALLALIAVIRGDTFDSYEYVLLYERMMDVNIFVYPFKFYLLAGVEWTFGFASTVLSNLNFTYVALFCILSILIFAII